MSRAAPLLVLALLACKQPPIEADPGENSPPPPGGNILVLLVDDLGIDKVGVYDAHPDRPPTPVIDSLAAEGVLFRSAWANSTCSPTRATLLTGRHPTRHGIGRWIMPSDGDYSLPLEETTIPEMLQHSPLGYADAAVGKWHVVSWAEEDPASHPNRSGFDWYAGSLANLDNGIGPDEQNRGYFHYQKSTNGTLSDSETYATTDTVNDAIGRIEDLAEPWLLSVAFNAPHSPFHFAPEELHSYESASTDAEKFHTMVEALDTEIGRLLQALAPEVRDNTTIIFASDNGTPPQAILPPHDKDRSKGTLYEGGVNVPFIVTGPLVENPGTESLALVHISDIFPTIAEIAGVDLSQVIDERTGQRVVLDGVSMLDLLQDPSAATREMMFTQHFYPAGAPPHPNKDGQAVRDVRYKLQHATNQDYFAFFEIEQPYDDGEDLLLDGLTAEQQEGYDRLEAYFDEMQQMVYDGP